MVANLEALLMQNPTILSIKENLISLKGNLADPA
jgi:hypothetical protein